jgi:hypothetical protein
MGCGGLEVRKFKEGNSKRIYGELRKSGTDGKAK